jgi:hypothetical protein
MSPKTVSIPVPPRIAKQLPSQPGERERVLELGLREWRIQEALVAFERGEGSLAFAAQQAGVPLREMIPLAYAHGLEPRVAPELESKSQLTLEEAADL